MSLMLQYLLFPYSMCKCSRVETLGPTFRVRWYGWSERYPSSRECESIFWIAQQKHHNRYPFDEQLDIKSLPSRHGGSPHHSDKPEPSVNPPQHLLNKKKKRFNLLPSKANPNTRKHVH